MRELTFLGEQYRQIWAADLKHLPERMKVAADQTWIPHLGRLSLTQRDAFVTRYETALAVGLAANLPLSAPARSRFPAAQLDQAVFRAQFARTALAQRGPGSGLPRRAGDTSSTATRRGATSGCSRCSRKSPASSVRSVVRRRTPGSGGIAPPSGTRTTPFWWYSKPLRRPTCLSIQSSPKQVPVSSVVTPERFSCCSSKRVTLLTWSPTPALRRDNDERYWTYLPGVYQLNI